MFIADYPQTAKSPFGEISIKNPQHILLGKRETKSELVSELGAQNEIKGVR